MNERILTLNYGQIILFGMLCTSIKSQKNCELTFDDTESIINIIIETTDPQYYENNLLQTPDRQIMMNPQYSYQIFSDWYDENEQIIVDNLLATV